MSVIEDMKGFMVTEEKAGPKINDELASVFNDGLRKKAKQNKKEAPRAGQEVPIKLPKQNSLPHGRKTLVTGQRIQTLHCVDLDFMKITKDNVIIEINEILKTSKPGTHLSPICLPAFVEDSRLCIVTVLNAYIERTSQKHFVTFVKPYHHPTKSTISNWIKLVLKLAGVNTSFFKTHSTRELVHQQHLELECQ
ncbi:unnamed protein product [Mytilus coruscus]|uniref:Tyr recombinase domain-containing protein n=1 Tax=Mytilus coruscus TaxID=42192 RepID=A0A6J8AVT1_MYTCO|nr:unnamed protein product [Mytilus coruscus]